MQITKELVELVKKAVARKVSDLFDRDDIVQMVLIALWETKEDLTVSTVLYYQRLQFYSTQKTPSTVIQKDGVKKRVIFGFDPFENYEQYTTTNPEIEVDILRKKEAVMAAMGTLKGTMLKAALMFLQDGYFKFDGHSSSIRTSWFEAKKKMKKELKRFDFMEEDSYIGVMRVYENN